MTQILFYRGHHESPDKAIGAALCQCADVLMNNPSLVIQLESLESMGHAWDADIRVMALGKADGGGVRARKGSPAANYNIKNPEHARFDNPDKNPHDNTPRPVAFRFGNAVTAGEIPDIPLQEIVMGETSPGAMTEGELTRVLLKFEELRLEKFEQNKPVVE